ncbi:MAG TPA: thiamine pyrophosphate-dependent dehydrogenase E1 component subunit alpha, partial [Limnochordia bacterium]
MPAKRAEAKPEGAAVGSRAPENEDGRPNGRLARHEALGLDASALVRMFELILIARAFDDRTSILVRQGKIPFTVACTGQEAAQVGAACALRPGVDIALPYYRDVGVMLVLGMTLEELMLNEFARAGDPNGGGRQMPKHYSCRRLRVLSGSSPVATQIPHAVGAALASRIRGEDAVTWVSFGEGATSKGDFHEGVNFAAIHRLPVVFFCENNGYAISVPLERQSSVPRIAERAAAYGIPGVSVDGNDVLAVYEATSAAVARARAGEGPTLIEARTYR